MYSLDEISIILDLHSPPLPLDVHVHTQLCQKLLSIAVWPLTCTKQLLNYGDREDTLDKKSLCVTCYIAKL